MVTEKLKLLDAFIGKDQIPQVYRRVVHIYDLWAMLTETKARRRCLELAKIQDGETVLEVAVGTGTAFVEIMKRNPHGQNYGIDLTKEMLDRAKKKAEKLGQENYQLDLGDAYNLIYNDASFDVLLNNYMFDLLPEKDFTIVLGEFKRVLRPGGRLIMANSTKPQYWYNSVWEMIYRTCPTLLGGCRGIYVLPYLESAGFIDVRREYISQMTFPSEVIFAKKPIHV